MKWVIVVFLVWLWACTPTKEAPFEGVSGHEPPDQLREVTITGTITHFRHGLIFKEEFRGGPNDRLHIELPGATRFSGHDIDWSHFEAGENIADLKNFLDETIEAVLGLPRPSSKRRVGESLSRRFRLRGILVERAKIDPGTEGRHGNGFGYQGRYRRMLLLLEARELK